jgi:hypothetical protein
MMLADMAGWVAPVATAVAAIMTAVNLGARVTGWGFVVFLVGSLAWSSVGAATGQTNLLLTNGFLSIVNLIGIWRWLGRQARYEKGGAIAVQASARLPLPKVRTSTSLIGATVADRDENAIGEVIEAMLECDTGRLCYLVVCSGGVAGIGERLRAVRREDVTIEQAGVTLALNHADFDALPDWEPDAPPPAPLQRGRT